MHLPFQASVDRLRGVAAVPDRADHKRGTGACIPGNEDIRNRGAVITLERDIPAIVEFDAEFVGEAVVFDMHKTEGEENKIHRDRKIAPRKLDHFLSAGFFLLFPLHPEKRPSRTEPFVPENPLVRIDHSRSHPSSWELEVRRIFGHIGQTRVPRFFPESGFRQYFELVNLPGALAMGCANAVGTGIAAADHQDGFIVCRYSLFRLLLPGNEPV